MGPSVDRTASTCLAFSAEEISIFIGLPAWLVKRDQLGVSQTAKRRTKGLTLRPKVAYNRRYAVVFALLPEL
jgi:hypothetical protein